MNIVQLKALVAIYDGSFDFQCAVDNVLLQAGGKPGWQPVSVGVAELQDRGLVQSAVEEDARGDEVHHSVTAKGSDLVHLVLDF